MLHHHPAPELLTDYSAGSLPLSHALCIAAHLEQCDSCRQQVAKLNRLGAAFFNTQPTQGVSLQSLKDQVMTLLDEPPAAAADRASVTTTGVASTGFTPVASAPAAPYKVPKALRQFVAAGYSSLEWVRLSPAIQMATLLKDRDGSQIALSRVKPGGKMFHHRHTGDELTVVLEGSFSDESGIYRKGDFVHRDSRHRHKPMVTRDAECICLMVMDAPIQFTGFFARLLNPFVRRNHAGI